MWNISEMSIEDIPGVIQLFSNSPDTGFQDWEDTPVYRRLVGNNRAISLIAKNESNDVIAALIGGRVEEWTCFNHLAVSKSYQGNKIGKALVTEALKLLTCSKSHIYLNVYSHNKTGIEFWRSLGFEDFEGKFLEVDIHPDSSNKPIQSQGSFSDYWTEEDSCPNILCNEVAPQTEIVAGVAGVRGLFEKFVTATPLTRETQIQEALSKISSLGIGRVHALLPRNDKDCAQILSGFGFSSRSEEVTLTRFIQ